MLVLTRKEGQRIVILTPDGKRIEVALVCPGPKQARLGIEAPREVIVLRKELQR